MMELFNTLLDNFENDLSKMSFTEAYDKLGQQLFGMRLISIRRMAKDKKEITAEEAIAIKTIQDYFDEMDKMYHKLKKSKRIAEEPPNEKFGIGVMQQIKAMESSIPAIEQTIPK